VAETVQSWRGCDRTQSRQDAKLLVNTIYDGNLETWSRIFATVRRNKQHPTHGEWMPVL
jgi:hypothetical protein